MADGPLLEAALTGIKRAFDNEEYEKALRFCSKAEAAMPDNELLARCRIFALLNMNKWQDALQACEKSAAAEASAFERAYCLYRLNRFQEVLDALSSAEDSHSAQRLEAQVHYRMGDYEKAAEMYETLGKEDQEDTGLLVNAVASHVSGDKSAEALRLLADQEAELESSYELSFNMACALLDLDRLADSEARLEEAKRIAANEIMQAEELTEDDAGILEDHEELAAINVQRACVLQRRGQIEDANTIYTRVLKPRTGDAREVDVTVLAVACNNVVALRPEGKSLFDSLKRINIASKESLEQKLTRKQTIEIAVNKCLLLLQARKLEEARRELQRLKELYPDHPQVAIVQASIAFMEKKKQVCEETLQNFATSAKAGSEEVVMALAQLYAFQQRFDKAVEALTQLPMNRRAQPHALQVFIALYQRQKSPDKIVARFREAIEYWSNPDTADEDTLAAILRIASRVAQHLQDSEFAAEVFQLYLEKIDGSDVEALCGLVRSLARTDVDRAEQYAQRLQVPSYDHLDAEELELVAIPKMAALSKAKGALEKDDAKKNEEKEKFKRKRKRKPRYPKNFDPENPGPRPDPERWLPKRERAEFKKRMRKRDKALLRGPQGAMVVDDQAFRKQGPSTAQVEVATDNTTGRSKPRNQAARSKKGKK